MWHRYKESGEMQARERLICQHLHLVKYMLHRIMARYQLDQEAVSVDDLYSCGTLGLMEAVDGFDPSREVKFVTYALPRIRGAIIDEMRSMDWIPRSLRQRVNQMQAAFAELERTLGRPASDSEVSVRLGLDLEQYYQLLEQASRVSLLSLDEQLQLCDEGQVVREATVAVQETSARTQLQREQVVALLEKSIEELPEKERLVLVMYYVNELTLREIGEVLEVTESRVCQLHSKAIMRLRGRLQSQQHDLVME